MPRILSMQHAAQRHTLRMRDAAKNAGQLCWKSGVQLLHVYDILAR